MAREDALRADLERALSRARVAEARRAESAAAAASGDWREGVSPAAEEGAFFAVSFEVRFVVVAVAAAPAAVAVASAASSASALTLAATRLASAANASPSLSQLRSCSSVAFSSSWNGPRGSGKEQASEEVEGGEAAAPLPPFGSLLPPSLSASKASPTARASVDEEEELEPEPLPRSQDSTEGHETSPEVGSTQVWRSDEGPGPEELEELEEAELLSAVSESVGGAAGNEAGRATRSADRTPPGSVKGSWNSVASRLRVSVVGWRRRSSSTWAARLCGVGLRGERGKRERKVERKDRFDGRRRRRFFFLQQQHRGFSLAPFGPATLL